MRRQKEIQIKLFQTWFKYSLSLSGIGILIYVALHILCEGSEIKVLSPQQFTTINALIIKADTIKAEKEKESIKVSLKNYLKVCLSVDSNMANRTSREIDTLVDKNSLDYLVLVLPNYPFEVESFFWMKGFKTYAELLFWIWFGVMSSVLFTVVKAYNEGKFCRELIYDHIAKVFYAPPVSIALYLSSNLLISQNLISLDKITNNSIVFVFILGFFSGRAIELLNRLKDVIIPLNTPNQERSQVDDSTEQNIDLIGNITIGDNTIKDVLLDNCEIKLTNKTITSKVYITKTDKEGVFEFNDIPLGLYQIEANLKDKNGLNLGTQQHIVIEKPNDSEQQPLNLVLNKKP